MSIANVEQVVRDYLPGVIHMSLATAAGDRPWVTEVHYVYDDDLNLYWRSKPSTRHSQEISKNPQVAGNIIEPHGLSDNPRGVYFEGLAELLTGVDQDHPAFKLYCRRFGTDEAILKELETEDGHQFYQVTVSDYYVFDSRESKPSQKYHLEWPKAS